MDEERNIIRVGVVFLVVMLNQVHLIASPIAEAVKTVADSLGGEQIKNGVSAGSWPGEADFTGSIVAGMVSAYELTCDSAYRSSAELGGDYILWAAQSNFYGDEAFALTRLSQIATDPYDNPYRTAVSDYYYNVKHSTGGTYGYVSSVARAEPSTAVFYLANHVVAADYVDAEDRQIWRQGLIDRLSRIDDSSNFPVMALGIATWALAQTGPLDETSIVSSSHFFGEGAPYWNAKKLADLPYILLGHQVPDGQPGAGSFYWQFQHDEGNPNGYGYTEDTIFATRGLVAASWANPDLGLNSAILAARRTLLDGISSEGKVWERLSQEGVVYSAYAGEMLQVLGELVIPGDLDLDGSVNSFDYAVFADNWRAADCGKCSLCNGADLDHNGEVDLVDFEIMVDSWLKGESH